MKKLIALLLSLVCLFSSLTMTSSAGVFDEVLSNITIGMGMEPDEPILYGITYDSESLISGVSVMYMPSATASFRNPGTYTVTSDIPLSIDYEFVCWEDEDTGKLYYAGDKIYIDGTKTFYAVWQEKTDKYSRPIRTFLTAIEAFRRTLQAFFGFYKVEYEKDPNPPKAEDTTFKINELISEEHDYYTNKRTFKVAVEHYEDGVTYEAFSENSKIYLGGSFNNVEVTDDEGNKYVEKQLVGATEYSAFYRMTADVYLDEATGKTYQIIDITLTDGVPDPIQAMYVTFVIPSGMLKHYISDNTYKTNSTYAFAVLTTKTM